ncbi:hypothetical protein KBT16_17955 [Nostoc sp. CCCryo 231-06]|nr:hypothetical protein [Nostoc sp. CCCryo 231-06]
MEKNIYATLDLSKSLSDFSSEVTKSLELTNIKEWDGQVQKPEKKKLEKLHLF